MPDNETTTTEKTVFSRSGLIFAVLIVAAGVAIVAAAMWGFMNIDEVESLETEKVTAFLGAVLIFSGIVAALAGFMYSLAFPIERETTTKAQGIAGESVAEIVKVLPDLLTKTAGLGVALALLGVILLAADSLGGDGDADAAATEATQTASASPGDDATTPAGSATETPD